MTSLELSVSAVGSARSPWRLDAAGAWVLAVVLSIAAAGVTIGMLAGLRADTAGVGVAAAAIGVALARRDVGRGAQAGMALYLRHQVTIFGGLSALVVLASAHRPAEVLAGLATQLAVVGVLARTASNVTAHPEADRRVMLVGEHDGVVGAHSQLLKAPGCAVVGVGQLGDVAGEPLELPDVMTCALTSIEHIVEMAKAWNADTVAVAPSVHLNSMSLRRLSWRLAEADVRLVLLGLPDGVARRRVAPARLGTATGIEVAPPRPGRLDRVGKILLDRLAASFILLMALPILLACALAIRLESRGPALFKQTRVGRDGTPFTMYKLRSMTCDAEERKAELREVNEAEGGLFKIADDPRITRVGRLLRRTSLDELPQLFNVFSGDMSLVGPRPLVVDEDEQITGYDRRRLALTPGMTGPWQILGSTRVPLPEMVKIDYLYLAGWSLWSDVKIMLRTVPYMLARRGA